MTTHPSHSQDYIYPQPGQYYKICGILPVAYGDAHISNCLIGGDLISSCTYVVTTLIYSNYPLIMLEYKGLTHK